MRDAEITHNVLVYSLKVHPPIMDVLYTFHGFIHFFNEAQVNKTNPSKYNNVLASFQHLFGKNK